MKKILSLLFVLALTMSFASCSFQNTKTQQETGKSSVTSDSSQSTHESENMLVAYFSCTGNTKSIAENIAQAENCKLYEIKPEKPYTSDDINYSNSNSRTSKEQNDSSSRPKLAQSTLKISDYDVIFLGYPIWWGDAPKIIYTFVESYDLKGKTIIPFCTSGGSDIAESVRNLKKSAPSAKWLSGKRFSSDATLNDAIEWLEAVEDKDYSILK